MKKTTAFIILSLICFNGCKTADSAPAGRVNKDAAYEKYKAGTNAFYDEDYETALKDWQDCVKLDPANDLCKNNIQKINAMINYNTDRADRANDIIQEYAATAANNSK